jgi:hypothetical protein
MGVASETLNWHIWSQFTNCVIYGTKSAAGYSGSYWVVSNNHEQVNRLCVIDSLLKPWLLDHIRCLCNLRDITVTSEVEEYAKCHDAKALRYISKVVPMRGAFQLPCSVVK